MCAVREVQLPDPAQTPETTIQALVIGITMKGVIVEAPGAPWKVVDNLEVPKPAPDQILVKSIATAINPVYALCFIPLYSSLSLCTRWQALERLC